MVTALILLAMSWLLEDSGRGGWATTFVVMAISQVIVTIVRMILALAKIAERA